MKVIDISIDLRTRMQVEATVPIVPVVNDADGTITPETVVDGYIGYAKGQRIVGSLNIDDAISAAKEAGRQEVYASQQDATATAADIIKEKTAYKGEEKITGTLDVEAEREQAYNQGHADALSGLDQADALPGQVVKGSRFYENHGVLQTGTLDVQALENVAYEKGANDFKASLNQATATEKDVTSGKAYYDNGGVLRTGTKTDDWKDPLWWDLYSIVDSQNRPEYLGIQGCLFGDAWARISLQGADAYLLSDGTFYTATSLSQKIIHTWAPEAYKADSKGGFTKYLIRFFRSSTGVVANLSPGTGTGQIGAYPIYMVCKGLTIPMAGFPGNTYILIGYDHIDCRYSGANASSLFGATTNTSIRHLPDPSSWVFTQFVTTIGGAFACTLPTEIDYSMFDFSVLSATGMPTFAGQTSLEKVINILDFSKQTSTWTINGNNIREIRFANVKCSMTLTSSSVLSRATLLSLKNALLPTSSALILSFGFNINTYTSEELAEIAALGYTVSGNFIQ